MKNIFKSILLVVVCMVMTFACAEEAETIEVITEETVIEETVEADEKTEVVEEIVPEEQQNDQCIECSVSIYASCTDTVWYGDTVTLYVVLEGYDGLDYHIQWQVSDDNSNWHNISGANGEQYNIVVSEENCTNYYRVAITI